MVLAWEGDSLLGNAIIPGWERKNATGSRGEELAEWHAQGTGDVRVTRAQQPCHGEEGTGAGMGSIPALP